MNEEKSNKTWEDWKYQLACLHLLGWGGSTNLSSSDYIFPF